VTTRDKTSSKDISTVPSFNKWIFCGLDDAIFPPLSKQTLTSESGVKSLDCFGKVILWTVVEVKEKRKRRKSQYREHGTMF
jgi:hypothetical protein